MPDGTLIRIRKVINTIKNDYKYDSDNWHEKHNEKHSKPTNAKIAILLLDPSGRPNYEHRTKQYQRFILSCLTLYICLYCDQTDSTTPHSCFNCDFPPDRSIVYDYSHYPRQALLAKLAMLQRSQTSMTYARQTAVDGNHDPGDDASSEEAGSDMHIHMLPSRTAGGWHHPANLGCTDDDLPLHSDLKYHSCHSNCSLNMAAHHCRAHERLNGGDLQLLAIKLADARYLRPAVSL